MESPIEVTPKAIEQLKIALANEKDASVGIRMGIRGGGCSGYQYVLDVEDSPREDDLTFEFDGVKVYIDMVSVHYLKGTTLDYIDTLMTSGFTFRNPQAKRTCGCGSSVAF